MSLKEKFRAGCGLVKRRAQMFAAGQDPYEGLQNDVEYTLGLDNQAMSVMGIVTSFVALVITVAIGVIILANVQSAMPAINESSPYYALQGTIEQSAVSGYALISIVIIIIAAGAIMIAIRIIGGDN